MAEHSIADRLEAHANRHPDRPAFTFLANGEVESANISFGDLHRTALRLGALLRSQISGSGPTLLMYPPGLDFVGAFFGCIYAGVIPVISIPPRPNQTLERLRAVAADSGAKCVLTTQRIRDGVADADRMSSNGRALPWIATDELPAEEHPQWRRSAIGMDSVAYLQYTSGSTTEPRGVITSHRNLCHNLTNIDRGWLHSEDSVMTSWLPVFHDMGLVYGVLMPVFIGFRCCMMAPAAFVQRPVRWLQAISRYGGTHSAAPDFAYELCVNQIGENDLGGLDLRSWRVALNGAEPVRWETLRRFTEKFRPCGFTPATFCPGYGLAEATLVVSEVARDENPEPTILDVHALRRGIIRTGEAETDDIQTVVGCGRPAPDAVVRIVNPITKRICPPDAVGEIWVKSASVALGYWNRPEQTKATFQAYTEDTGDGPFLRTGDLGFTKDGNLYICGRLKDVIIINGQNYYPQDIEACVEQSHPALKVRCGAVFSIEKDGRERLVVVTEVKRQALRHLDGAEIARAVRTAVFDRFMLPVAAVVLIKPATIPKTSSGKIQRQACRVGYLEQSLNVVAEWRAESNGTDEYPGLIAEASPEGAEDHRSTHSGGMDMEMPRERVEASDRRPTGRHLSVPAASLLEWLRRYAGARINSRLIDERRCIPPHIVLDFGNQGVLGLQVPAQYGGLGLNYAETMRVIAQLGAIDLTLSAFVIVHNILGIRPLLRYGQPSVKERLLPALASGRQLAAFALTEPGAGSNPKSIAATAVPDGHDGWKVNGTKLWIGSASWASVINVFVRQYGPKRLYQGISGFAIAGDAAGLAHGPEALTMGMRGMVQNSIRFTDVHASASTMLGGTGQGMAVAEDAMMQARLALAAASAGGMKRCLQLMVRYADRRVISTGRALENPVILERLDHLCAATTAVDVLVQTTAECLDAGAPVPEDVYSVCKIAGPEYLWQTADNLVQLLGGRGYIETNMAPQILRDARLFRIFEGPTETLTMHLGSRVVNAGDELYRFLRGVLDASDIADDLAASARQLRHADAAPAGPNGTANINRFNEYFHVGEIAVHAVLYAVVRHAARKGSDDTLRRAGRWAQTEYRRKVAETLRRAGDRSERMDAAVALRTVSNYVHAIGDVEQALAGEEMAIDPMLRRDGPAQRGAGDDPAAREDGAGSHSRAILDSGGSRATHRAEPIVTQWIRQWLTDHQGIAPTALSDDTVFADFGMDSVMAVQMVQSLGDWLGRSIEPTIVWNCPTIHTLANYVSRLNGHAAPRSSAIIPSRFTPGDSAVTTTDRLPEGKRLDVSIDDEIGRLEKLLR